MEKALREIFQMKDPERLTAIALLMYPYASEKGVFRTLPLQVLDGFFPSRTYDRAARLEDLLERAGYLEQKSPIVHPHSWLLHSPPGAHLVARHELEVQAELIVELMKLVQQRSKAEIPAMIGILQALENK